jgi:hypothetical protein
MGVVGRAYRTGILPRFLLGIVLAVGLAVSTKISSGMLPFVVAATMVASTLWLGPFFSELQARVFVAHYPNRSFATFAGTLTFWVAIVLSLLAIVLNMDHVVAIVIVNILATLCLGYLIPPAYERSWAGGEDKPTGQGATQALCLRLASGAEWIKDGLTCRCRREARWPQSQ